MDHSRLRKREKQLAKALKAMREVAHELEALVFNGPMLCEPADFLPMAAKLIATRQAIVRDKGTHALDESENATPTSWTPANASA